MLWACNFSDDVDFYVDDDDDDNDDDYDDDDYDINY